MALDTKDIIKSYTGSIKTALSKQSCDPVSKNFDKNPGDYEIKKMWLDQGFREFLTTAILSAKVVDLDKCDNYVELCIKAAKSDICSKMVPIQILSDIFDIVTLDQCETLFTCIERNVSLWKSEEFFTTVRNNLLRICNDLLRRLSRSQNTVFCGRILLFLAKFFPFSERSGLNVVSEFNLENTTLFSSADEASDANGAISGTEEMEVDSGGVKIEPDQRNLAVDYALYSKFWQLQDFFRNPLQCYNNVKWRTFSSYAAEVMNTFQSFKVDAISGKRKKSVDAAAGGAEEDNEEQFFAKYLTNQNLLQLQLSDSNFRRYILVQFLILFQYLKSTVKFKNETHVLTDDQNKWVEKTETRIYDLIGETPPFGKQFGDSVKHILHREEQWNLWKNQGCPSLAPKSQLKDESNGTKVGSTRKRKRKLGDQMQDAMNQKKFLMGNVALTKLWNQYPDNMEACSAPERDFLPQMDDYFAEAIAQLDPANQIEQEYKQVNDGQWGWRALRLLAKKSPHFFTYGNNPIAKLPDYLDSMLKKMSNFTPATAPNAATNGSGAKDQVVPKDELITLGGAVLCTTEQLTKLASNLSENWSKLIPKLGFTAQDKEKFEAEEKEDKNRALLMLQKWSQVEDQGATKDEISYILEGLKMTSALDGVF